MAWVNPQVADFKAQYYRDWQYSTDMTVGLTDQDISNAFVAVNAAGGPPQQFFADQSSFTYGYLLLAAHEVVEAIRAGGQGLSGQYNFLQASKGVGAVNESFSIPQFILDHPILSMYCKTNYGARYIRLVLPQLAGNVFIAAGTTRA